MIRWKVMLTVLLCTTILVLGAYLPGIVGYFLDRDGSQSPSYVQTEQIHLEFQEETMTLREKMALLSGTGETMQVSTDMTQHTAAEIWQIAMNTAEAYHQAGMVPQALHAADITYCIPIMYYWQDQQQTGRIYSNVFWELSFADGSLGGNLMTMVIDDRTGTVCTLNYQNVNAHRADTLGQGKALQTLCALALEELGEEFSEYDAAALASENLNANAPSSYGAVDLSWEDARRGETRLAFVVSDAGFYTYVY